MGEISHEAGLPGAATCKARGCCSNVEPFVACLRRPGERTCESQGTQNASGTGQDQFVSPEIMITQRICRGRRPRQYQDTLGRLTRRSSDCTVPRSWTLVLNASTTGCGDAAAPSREIADGDTAQQQRVNLTGPTLAGHGAQAVRDASSLSRSPPYPNSSASRWPGTKEPRWPSTLILRIDADLRYLLLATHQSPWQRGTNENIQRSTTPPVLPSQNRTRCSADTPEATWTLSPQATEQSHPAKPSAGRPPARPS